MPLRVLSPRREASTRTITAPLMSLLRRTTRTDLERTQRDLLARRDRYPRALQE